MVLTSKFDWWFIQLPRTKFKYYIFYLVHFYLVRTNLYQHRSSISTCPPSPFFKYKFLPEHIKKYLPCPPNIFPLLEVHLSTYKSYQNTLSIFPCPPGLFSTYKSYRNTSSTSCPILEYFPLSSKSIFLRTNPTGTHQAFSAVLQVLFLHTNPTRTRQVLALSSKYFSLSSKSFSYVQILPEGVMYLPCHPSVLPSPPSIFLRTIPTRTHQVFALSSKYFSLSSKICSTYNSYQNT